MGINVQVCWEKFANYWDVEMRLVPMEGDRFHLPPRRRWRCATRTRSAWSPSSARRSTAPTSRSPRSAPRSTTFKQRTGIDVPIHVDGASGGFVAPFLDPDLVWDFRLPRVASINTSGHKYGLVYPGVGWIVWRDAAALPDDLIFHVNYLGDNMPTFALNFSRPGAQVVGAVLQLPPARLRGLSQVQQYARDVATRLAAQIAELGPFELLTSGDELPVFAFKLRTASTTSPSSTSRPRCASGLARPRLHVSGEPRRPRRAALVVRPASPTTWRTSSSPTWSGSWGGSSKQSAPAHDAASASSFAH